MGVSPPSTPKRRQLTRDERLTIRTLYFDAKWTQKAIATHLGVSENQVQYACQIEGATPRKRSGRPPLLTASEVELLIAFICSSKKARQMPWSALPAVMGFDCSEYAVRYALRKAGFRRYIARYKPPISESTRTERLAFASAAQHWTKEQWRTILWSDETWVTSARRRRVYVTRRSDEELDPTCIVDRIPRRQGWMFWGCFSGIAGKGPGIFWEKDWGTITSQSYRDHIVPIIDGWIRLTANKGYGSHIFMQDNATPHAAADTITDLQERGILRIVWPPYSPDLNPIESVWNKMKDYIERTYTSNLTYDQLRTAINEAWESIDEEYLDELLDTMPQRCQDCLNANGGSTKW